MLRRLLLAGATLVALVAVLLYRQPSSPVEDRIVVPGRKNTVLFLTSAANGLSNSHLATTFALLEKHPEVQIHYASFDRLAPEIERISAAAKVKNPTAGDVTWHLLPEVDFKDALLSQKPLDYLVSAPGLAGVDHFNDIMSMGLCPWNVDQYWSIFQAVTKLVEEIDPAVTVLDVTLQPAMDLPRNMNRSFIIVTPNALTDLLAPLQPRLGFLWKYPTMASGLPFPVPWRQIPTNIYLNYRLIKTFMFHPRITEKKAALTEKGIKEPLKVDAIAGTAGVPWLAMSFPESCAPLDVIPPLMKPVGPLVLDVAPAEVQDPELAAWLKRAPTVLVNLGSAMMYSEPRASAMAGAMVRVLEATDVQFLWKFRKYGKYESDAWRKPLEKYIAEGRVNIVDWLNVDPLSLLNTGDIAVSVHHGGANCYYEAVAAGVPHVILPLWIDLYNFATTAEYLGIGVWPGKETAPEWEAESLAEGFMQALTGEAAATMREKAKALAKIAESYGGRDAAAAEIAKLAAEGV